MCRTPLSAVVYRKNSKYLVAGASKGTPGGAIKMRHGNPRMGAKNKEVRGAKSSCCFLSKILLKLTGIFNSTIFLGVDTPEPR